MKPRILVVSSASMDFYMEVPALPRPGRSCPASEYSMLPGGKGAIVSAALSEFGADPVFCTRLGSDSNGTRLRNFYAESGIDNRFVGLTRGCRTGMNVVMTDPEGNNMRVSCNGLSDRLRPSDVEDAFTCYPDGVLLQFEVPSDTVIAATEFAAEQNIPVFVDASASNMKVPLEELKNVEIFCPNEETTEALTGCKLRTPDECMRAALAFNTRVPAKYYVLRMAERGAFLYDGRIYRIVTTYDTDVIDTYGAGDIFCAMLFSEYLKNGGNILHAIEYANIAASISVSRKGGIAAIPSTEEVEAFIRDNEVQFEQ